MKTDIAKLRNISAVLEEISGAFLADIEGAAVITFRRQKKEAE